jgi:hypothetical protein
VSYSPEYLAADRGARVINTSIVFVVLDTVAVGSYFVARYKNKTLRGADIYCIPFAYVLALGLLTVNFGELNLLVPSASTCLVLAFVCRNAEYLAIERKRRWRWTSPSRNYDETTCSLAEDLPCRRVYLPTSSIVPKDVDHFSVPAHICHQTIPIRRICHLGYFSP